MSESKKVLTKSEALEQGYTKCGPEDAELVLDLEDFEGERGFLTGPFLLYKKEPLGISIEAQDLAEWIADSNDEHAESVIEDIYSDLSENPEFIKAVEIINKELAQYKSYFYTDIQVVPNLLTPQTR